MQPLHCILYDFVVYCTSVSKNTLSKGEIALLAPADLRGLLEKPEENALYTHLHSVQAIVAHSPVRFYNDAEALRPDREKFTDFIAALGDQAVRSATMDFTLFDNDISSLKNVHDGLTWEFKKPKMYIGSDRIRFFVAKTALGDIEFADGMFAKIIERRTYAGMGIGQDVDARQIDIRTVLGVAERYGGDARDVIVSPTSLTHYAYKLEVSE